MKAVVITGSTRGIGCGLATSFLTLGCGVAVSSRSPENVEKTAAKLSARHGSDRVFSCCCDVTRYEQVEALWEAAQAHFGKVDIWINNAGLGHPQMDFWEHPPEEIRAVVETNLVGAMYGTRVALKGMLEQGHGAIYNVEGLGSDGRKVKGLGLYGSTKSGLAYFTDALIEEMKGTPVLVGALRPGMVTTRLLMGQYEERPEEWERAKGIVTILADRVETVTPWLAERVLENERHGVRITWLSRGRVLRRLLTAPFCRRELFENGRA
ncbi:MAG: SDR family oxidoreductase [Anaerolineae bacterium]|jgi:NAD(P)-dependent dehydrogenase (short-subunit alcohol dehydrogenase family)